MTTDQWKNHFWWNDIYAGRAEAILKNGCTVLGTVHVEAVTDDELEEYPLGCIVAEDGQCYYEEDIEKWRKLTS